MVLSTCRRQALAVLLAVALGYIMEVKRRTCAIENTSRARLCLVNVVLNHHSASNDRGELLLVLDRAVTMCSLSNKVDGCVVTTYVFFLKGLSPLSRDDPCFEVASHQYHTSIGSRVTTLSPSNNLFPK